MKGDIIIHYSPESIVIFKEEKRVGDYIVASKDDYAIVFGIPPSLLYIGGYNVHKDTCVNTSKDFTYQIIENKYYSYIFYNKDKKESVQNLFEEVNIKEEDYFKNLKWVILDDK